jgi:hypothetical protein
VNAEHDDQATSGCERSHRSTGTGTGTGTDRFCAGCGTTLHAEDPEPRSAEAPRARPKGTVGIVCWACRSTVVSPLLWQEPDGAPYGVKCGQCSQPVILHSCSNCQTRHYVALTTDPESHPRIPGLEVESPSGNYLCSTCGCYNPISLPQFKEGKPTKHFFHLCARCRHWVQSHSSAPAISCGHCGYEWTVAHCGICASLVSLPYSPKGSYTCTGCRAAIPINPLNPVPAAGVPDSAVLATEIEYDASADAADQQRALAALVDDLDRLVGLAAVKEQVHGLIDLARVSAMRKARGLQAPAISNHLVFVGNPGTGKTTVARLIAGLYHQLGLLSSDVVRETAREGLVAGYVGQTAIKTMAVCEAALGGVLFVDEAYSLAASSGDDFGAEAVSTLLKYMEDHRDNLVVILAGYPEDMAVLLASNAGLASRFSRSIEFADYHGGELAEIFAAICRSSGYSTTEDVLRYVEAIFAAFPRERGFGNGRLARNLYEQAVMAQAARLALVLDDNSDLVSLVEIDIEAAAAALSVKVPLA